MRLKINLATKPYLDVRRMLLQWGGLVVLLAIATFLLVGMAISSWHESRDVNARIAALRTEIAQLDQQRKLALDVLGSPQNAAVVNNGKFLNGLIARKSFSWTRVFMQLEEIMPPRLHVVSIAPELLPLSGTVQVKLTVAGTSRDAAVELVKRLEQSPSFRNARIAEETVVSEKNSPDTVRFHLTASYVPSVHSPAPSTSNVPAVTAAPAVLKTAGQGGGKP